MLQTKLVRTGVKILILWNIKFIFNCLDDRKVIQEIIIFTKHLYMNSEKYVEASEPK